jgi:hypothetical protein
VPGLVVAAPFVVAAISSVFYRRTGDLDEAQLTIGGVVCLADAGFCGSNARESGGNGSRSGSHLQA